MKDGIHSLGNQRASPKPLDDAQIDKKSLRDYYEREFFVADVDSVFVTDEGDIHAEGLSSGEITTIANLARVLEGLRRRPS